MRNRRSFMIVLAGAALLSVENRATAQKAKLFSIAYLALLPGEDRKELEAAANLAKIQVRAFEVRSPEEIAPQLDATKAAGAGALVILEDPLTFSRRSEIAAFASRLRLPAVYGYREFAEAGGLVSYGTDHNMQWRRGAEIVDLILKGAKPANIPVEQPTKFELVVNLKTAKALDLSVPPAIMMRADEVIE